MPARTLAVKGCALAHLSRARPSLDSATMKGLWILAGLGVAAALLVFALTRESDADVERLYIDAVRERPAIEAAITESGDLVRYFSEFKPTERKKGDLEELRRRFESLDGQATKTRDAAELPRSERKAELAKVEEEFFKLKSDAEDLRARLREMKNFDLQLRPRIAKLGALTQKLLIAQTPESPPEFQQRAGQLVEDGRKYRLMAEGALKTLSVRIGEGRSLGMAALNELDEILKNMESLLATTGEKAGG